MANCEDGKKRKEALHSIPCSLILASSRIHPPTAFFSLPSRPLGLPYMTSVEGGGDGSPKSRQKEQCYVNSAYDKGEGVNKSENFEDVI